MKNDLSINNFNGVSYRDDIGRVKRSSQFQDSEI